jgi:hypothetical protein
MQIDTSVVQEISPPKETKVKVVEAQKLYQLLLPEYEVLTYDLRWLGIKGAQIHTSILGVKEYKGVNVYVLEYRVTSNKWLSRFFKIDSKFISYSAVDDFRSLRQEVNRREGRYRKHAVVEYDHENQIAHFANYTDKSVKSFPIPKGVRDGLGAVYYFRTRPLKLKDQYNFDVVVSEQVYDFYCDVTEHKRLKVPHLGKREAIKIHPYGFVDGKQVKDGTMQSYFSTGKTKIPFYAIIKAPMFTKATATLKDVSYSAKQ